MSILLLERKPNGERLLSKYHLKSPRSCFREYSFYLENESSGGRQKAVIIFESRGLIDP
jgi:hypothetical protein